MMLLVHSVSATGLEVKHQAQCLLCHAGQAAVLPAAVAATAAMPSIATAASEAGATKQQEHGEEGAEAAPESPMMRGVMFYALESQQESLVWQVQPTHVILYDPDIPFIRQLEVRAVLP